MLLAVMLVNFNELVKVASIFPHSNENLLKCTPDDTASIWSPSY